MSIDAVVADANVLLSAVIGKAALRVFTAHDVPVHTTAFNAVEVETYLPRLSAKYGLATELVNLQWHQLPLRIHARDTYEPNWQRALARLETRDPDDAHPLALAYSLEIPLWSNDRDLAGHGVPCWTTARLLTFLERAGSGT